MKFPLSADPEESETDSMPEESSNRSRPGQDRTSGRDAPLRAVEAGEDSGGGSGFLLRLRSRTKRREEEGKLRAAYGEHAGELFGFAYRSLGDRGLAEEVVQETFVKAWRSRDRFDVRRASRRTWLFAITRNLITDVVRARRARPSLASYGSQERFRRFHGSEDPTEAVSREMLISEALGRLREEHRVVVTEVHYRGRPYAELSEELGIPVGTLRSRAFYALKSLRLILEEMESSDGRRTDER
ncbi:sigma-70 family RNA polymerase sigma factor [Rubrobacter indicoceani]|uniref:sigma-70 family RNA polymerase sigma factor n=1 Tax=Rubrobacter indicoceani TaxID=2051957 RepID=UPI00196940D7|nr:sigma-70 family RNA polymerase sigma factor [Rubrobacter indicoceani]